MAGYIGNKAVGLNVTTGDILGDVGVGGVITGSTVEATGDTAAGDNAAMGYTSAEGLILTGQGSTSDITLKNDADAVVFTIPTGTDDILFPDNAKAMFGAGSDLQIFHDGSNSFINDAGAGGLILRGSSFVALQGANGENGIIVTEDGAVDLRYNNSTKLATTNTGVAVTGAISASSGNVTITDGNLTVAAGHGIDFAATGNISGTSSELLDDYEEGDYTATITCGSGTITLHSSYNQLAYTKIGRAVTINGRIHIASVSSPSGTAVFNLPFVVATGTDHSTYGGLNIYHHDINLGSGGIGLFGESTPGGSVSQINLLKNNAQWATQVANIFDGGDEWMYLAGTYFTSA